MTRISLTNFLISFTAFVSATIIIDKCRRTAFIAVLHHAQPPMTETRR